MNVFQELLAYAGLIFAVVQLAITNHQSNESRRPIVVVNLDIVKTAKEERLYLEVRNVGLVPAKEVTIEFEAGKVWNWVLIPEYPFLKEFGGIPVLVPGQNVRFFLGIVKRGGQLEYLKHSTIRVKAFSKKPLALRPYRDTYGLTLADKKFVSKSQ